jgi:hypothetical protein
MRIPPWGGMATQPLLRRIFLRPAGFGAGEWASSLAIARRCLLACGADVLDALFNHVRGQGLYLLGADQIV